MEAQKSERVALSRELSEFLVELSVALHRHSMYPGGHPALRPAVTGLVRRADRLMQDRASLAIGVARRELIIEGVTTDPDQPVLRRLAEGLHRHHIGAVTLTRGVESFEIDEALRALAVEAERDGPLGLTREDARSWPHLKLHALTFDGLTLAGEAPLAESETQGSEAAQRADLWVGLARAALSLGPSQDADALAREPSLVARAIDDGPHAAASDQVIVGYLMQIAHEVKAAPTEDTDELRRRASLLIASLRPETLRRLVNMAGNTAQRAEFVRDATHGMACEAVLEIVKAAADASGQTISHGLLRLLSKMGLHAERGSDRIRRRADAELREQVSHLVDDWQLADPNPEAYGRVLQHLATATRPERPQAEIAERPDPLRIVQMSLESKIFGPLVERTIDEIVEAGDVNALCELLTSSPPGAEPIANRMLAKLARPAAVKALLARERLDVASVDHLLPHLSREGYELLLDALGSSPNRALRRRLMDRLAETDINIGPLIIERLRDERWYVQRNMLMLLGRSRRVPIGFSASHWTAHPDARVRTEALRLQLRMPAEKEIGIRTALNDEDPRIVRLGLAALQPSECPPDLVDVIIELAVTPESGDEVQALAVTVLGRLRETRVLEALLQLADGGRSLLGKARLPSKTPVLLAALRALAQTWGAHPRASAVLALASASSDPELREAVSASTI